MTASLSETVAAEVRAELARQQMSGAELTRRLGVSTAYLSRRLNGEVAFDITDLDRIAQILGVPVGKLIPGSERAA